MTSRARPVGHRFTRRPTTTCSLFGLLLAFGIGPVRAGDEVAEVRRNLAEARAADARLKEEGKAVHARALAARGHPAMEAESVAELGELRDRLIESRMKIGALQVRLGELGAPEVSTGRGIEADPHRLLSQGSREPEPTTPPRAAPAPRPIPPALDPGQDNPFRSHRPLSGPDDPEVRLTRKSPALSTVDSRRGIPAEVWSAFDGLGSDDPARTQATRDALFADAEARVHAFRRLVESPLDPVRRYQEAKRAESAARRAGDTRGVDAARAAQRAEVAQLAVDAWEVYDAYSQVHEMIAMIGELETRLRQTYSARSLVEQRMLARIKTELTKQLGELGTSYSSEIFADQAKARLQAIAEGQRAKASDR